MSSDYWGPPKWRKLHRVGFDTSFNGLDRGVFLKYAEGLVYELPCSVCRDHYRDILTRLPPASIDPFTWTVMVHNDVNARLGKPQWSVNDAFHFYKCSC